jgi:hypothetical protein
VPEHLPAASHIAARFIFPRRLAEIISRNGSPPYTRTSRTCGALNSRLRLKKPASSAITRTENILSPPKNILLKDIICREAMKIDKKKKQA